MKPKKVAFHTLGCKLNFSETSTIARAFKDKGYELADFKDEADVYVIHTCSVTSVAEKKCRTAISQANRRNPLAKVAVIGCYAQLRPDMLKDLEGVNVILGNKEKFDLLNYIESEINTVETPFASPAYEACHVHTSDLKADFSFSPSYSSGDRTRSFLKVQDGCDYFCTYCTIPHARGRSRSGTIRETLESARRAINEGINEIILTGVNIGDFGKRNGEDFYGLLHALDQEQGLNRLRISSIEPELLNDRIIELAAKSNRIMPHFHIPLQSGNDEILKAMKRKYERKVFADRVLKIKDLLPHACIAADVIVGFPGETEEHFSDTFNFIDSLDVSCLHVFSYSERPGTFATGLKGHLNPIVKQARSKKLHELSERKLQHFYKQNKGLATKVLFESDRIKGYMYGFTENYIKVKTRYNHNLINTIVEVQLDELDEDAYVFKP